MQMSLLAMSLMGVALLVIIGLLVNRCLPATPLWRWTISLVVIAFLFPSATPGTSPDALLRITYFIGLLYLATRPVNGFNLFWGLMLGLFVSYLSQNYALIFFWSGFSILFTEAFHFIFVDWAHLSWAKKNHRLTLLFRCGYLATLTSILFICILKYPPTMEGLSPSPRLWMLFISSGLGLALSFIKPWETKLWMRLVSIPFALFFSTDAEALTIMIILWMTVRLIFALSEHKTFKKIPLLKLDRALATLLVLGSIGVVIFHVQRVRPSRSFEPEWTQAAKLLDQDPKEGGIVIVGDAIDFLSFFSRSNLVQNLPIHLESSEVELQKILEEEKAKGILIDREYLRRFWAQSIQSGGDPSRVNLSIFSRLILYKGQAFESKTLRIPPVKKFKIRETSLSKILWIEPI